QRSDARSPQAVRDNGQADGEGPADHLSLPPEMALRLQPQAEGLHAGARWAGARQGPDARMMEMRCELAQSPSPLGEREGAREAGRVRGQRRCRDAAATSAVRHFSLALPSPRRGESLFEMERR